MPSFKGILYCGLLLVSSLLGSIFILLPFVPFVYLAPKLWRFYADFFVGYWLTLPAALCNFLFGIKFFVSGDQIECDKPALIIMNHRTRLDWLFFWNALYAMDYRLLRSQKISLKARLKLIPGAGWAMCCGAYLFLERNFENDQHIMRRMISYYKRSERNYQILLFPEGTDRGARAVFLSDVFAEKSGLPKYEYVIHPRTAGFTYLLQLMREDGYIKHIYDVTVGYPKGVVSNEMDLVRRGRYPEEVHFNVRKYDINEIPADAGMAAEWLNKIWLEKEERLKRFYTKNEEFQSPTDKRHMWTVGAFDMGYCCSIVFWVISSCFWCYLMVKVHLMRFYFILACAFYVFCQKRFGGFENFADHMMKSRYERYGQHCQPESMNADKHQQNHPHTHATQA
ncbi:unnamed protein product [Anisakis simplex]|uniref:Lysocardiolipin acyltransferase 1 (inferred by orthology to a human protein) n=1 Tax=Anisakis simplex TaxID=6269 RepID=A0A158PN77_ANISI|nr:unnamed protein product [Anisakis simplex]